MRPMTLQIWGWRSRGFPTPPPENHNDRGTEEPQEFRGAHSAVRDLRASPRLSVFDPAPTPARTCDTRAGLRRLRKWNEHRGHVLEGLPPRPAVGSAARWDKAVGIPTRFQQGLVPCDTTCREEAGDPATEGGDVPVGGCSARPPAATSEPPQNRPSRGCVLPAGTPRRATPHDAGSPGLCVQRAGAGAGSARQHPGAPGSARQRPRSAPRARSGLRAGGARPGPSGSPTPRPHVLWRDQF